jgi:hypothetical protein
MIAGSRLSQEHMLPSGYDSSLMSHPDMNDADSTVFSMDRRTGEVHIAESIESKPYVPSTSRFQGETAEEVDARHRRWNIRYLEEWAEKCRSRQAAAEAEIVDYERRLSQLDPIPTLYPYRYELLAKIKKCRENANRDRASADRLQVVVERLRSDPRIHVRIPRRP